MNRAAYPLVKPPVIRSTLKRKRYNTGHIVDLVQEVLSTDVDDTAGLASTYPKTKEGLRRLYRDVYNRITYIEDPDRAQWVQTPSFLWHHTRRGDCKSLTVFISSVLQNMGIPHYIRYTNYDFRSYVPRSMKKFKHVYPVAILEGQEIPMDVVFEKQEGGRFGTEKPYALKKDVLVEGLYKLGSVDLNTSEQQYVNDVSRAIQEMELAMADIPDAVVSAGDGDITRMSEGQLERSLWKDRYRIYADQEPNPAIASRYRDAAVAMDRGTIAGLGTMKRDAFTQQVEDILRKTSRKSAPAFSEFKLNIVLPDQAAVGSIFRKVGDFFKKVGSTFANLFKKFVNWIWKGPAKDMGPFFLFLFANERKVKSPEIRRRIQEQKRSFKYIAKKGKFSEDKLMGVMMNGIKEKTGKAPQELFAAAGDASKIGALGPVLVAAGKWVFKAIGWVIKVIQKIVGLFKSKKEEAGTIDESTASDVALLEEEARLQEQATQNNTTTTTGESGGGGLGAGWLAPLALVPLLLAA